MSVPSATGYYEVCLAVVEQSTTYYLHQHLCIEVSPQTVPSPPSSSSSAASSSLSSTTTLSTNLTVVPDIKSVAVGWQLAEGNDPVVRQISVRRFLLILLMLMRTWNKAQMRMSCARIRINYVFSGLGSSRRRRCLSGTSTTPAPTLPGFTCPQIFRVKMKERIKHHQILQP